MELGRIAGRLSFVGSVGSSEDGPLAAFPARPVGQVLAEAAASWQGLWLAAPIGLFVAEQHRGELFWMAALLFASAVLTSLVASDTMRMFQPLFPVVALGVGLFLDALWRCSRPATIALLTSCFLSSAVWQPVRFFTLRAGSELSVLMQTTSFGLLGATALLGSVLVVRARRANEPSFARAVGAGLFGGDAKACAHANLRASTEAEGLLARDA